MNETYRARGTTATVEVFQWTRYRSDAALAAFVGPDRTRGLDRPSGTRSVFHPLVGWQPVQYGDWLVRSRAGAVLVLDGVAFDRLYVEVPYDPPFPRSTRERV